MMNASTASLYLQSSAQGVIEVVEPHQDGKENRTVEETSVVSPRYIRNPDVVLREEDPDGGLLFNPDTDQIRVLNVTGLFVWKLCDGSHDLPGIVAAMRESFDGVPEEQVASQVTEFIDEMMATGFIGIMEEQAV
jgi:hypothetical protein